MAMTVQNPWQAEAVILHIGHHPFLQGLSRQQLIELADCALTARFQPGDIIFCEGERADRFYLIDKGKVVLESSAGYDEPAIIETIGDGDLLGWSCLMPPYVWHFTARAIEPTEAIHFAGDMLRQYCDKDHSLGFELHKRMSAVMMHRLQAARRRMLAMHAHGEKLDPSSGLSFSGEAEFERQKNEPPFREGAD